MSGKNSFLEIVKKLETKEENQGYILWNNIRRNRNQRATSAIICRWI